MTLNRAQRRALKQSMRRRGHVTVTLRGGPMDGWIVKEDAPALQSDWRARYLEEAAEGEYLKWANAQDPPVKAPWTDVGERERRPFREAVLALYGAGRYVLRGDGLEADWVAE